MDALIEHMLALGAHLEHLQPHLPLFSYNPLTYAQDVTATYLQRYARPNTPGLLLGMNPGPYGMTQTGVPFGAVAPVQQYLRLHGTIRQPNAWHPKRPIEGFACRRQEVSGTRVWQLAQALCPQPEAFLSRLFVWNYCPLLFLDPEGRNKTPETLPKHQLLPIYEACDEALVQILKYLGIQHIFGVGQFAAKQAQRICAQAHLAIPCTAITHPSPANPAANRGWAQSVGPILAPVLGMTWPVANIGVLTPSRAQSSTVPARMA